MQLFSDLSALDKLSKARIKLNKQKPFFAFLVMKLKFEEDNTIETIGVDKYGNCIFNKEWMAKREFSRIEERIRSLISAVA